MERVKTKSSKFNLYCMTPKAIIEELIKIKIKIKIKTKIKIKIEWIDI